MANTISVSRRSMITGITSTKELPITQAQLDVYLKGDIKVQDAFPHLSDADREFIKTGITKEEWQAEFGDATVAGKLRHGATALKRWISSLGKHENR